MTIVTYNEIVYDSSVVVSAKNSREAMLWLIRHGNLQNHTMVGQANDFADWLGNAYVSNPVLMPDVDFGFHEHERDLAMRFKLTWGGQ